ncbi:glycosyltransferase family 2 protein [Spongiivirga citrea]|uniref:Glycosyltransferase n=1 Tax=Spongiivirga citrea TaxID=1481457 RepID=A0A6M0CDU5_9FLAO|nr:glycosyltransferase family 2 protein [Spongiivirga citrea]NER15572.1 glycosyltransferase [Spongiivirga citrea]
MLLSFIIPAYNAEAFIERCVTSISVQFSDHTIYEIIIVNDGSTDNTQKVCQQLAEEHPAIQLYINENHGPGFTRNFGIKQARGKYIWFIDADDYLESNVVAKVISELEDDLDLYIVGHQTVTTEGQIEALHAVPDEDLLVPELLERNFFVNSVWCKIIKARVLTEHSILFKEDVRGPEDFHFSFRLLNKIDRLRSINLICYNYIENPASLMNKRSEAHLNKLANDSITVGNDLRVLVNSIEDSRKKLAFNKWLGNYLYGLLFSLYRFNYKTEFVTASLKKLRANNNYPVKVYSNTLKRKLFTNFANSRPLFIAVKKIKQVV